MSLQVSVDSARVVDELASLATYSDVPPPAVTRVLFTPVELQARDYIRDLMQDAGLTIREDAVGNIFGRWEGADPALPAIATGSHIDAIPYSGRYDGTVGVLGAIEAIRALKSSGFSPNRAIEVIMFTAEEPTRFGVGCLGSRAMAGKLTPETLVKLHDADEQDFESIRKAVGYTAPLESVRMEKGHYEAFIELHIEQGPRLEKAGIPLGIVTAIAAPATLRVVIHGDGGHAGTVLMPERKDALPAAAEIVLAVEQAAKFSESADAVATVGLCQVYPGAVNSIPSRVLMEIDIRDIDLASRDGMVATVQSAIEETCARRGLTADVSVLNADAPCHSGEAIVSALVDAADSLGFAYQKLVSRAYHDTLFMADICPTSMIFIPSAHGYSHRPEEYSSPEDIALGIELLALGLATLASR
ncbi:MAG: M20 family metallo-hydrolase [Aggregatilineales bacterium]